MRLRGAFILMLAFCAAFVCAGWQQVSIQPRAAPRGEAARLRVETQLVLIPVSVTDPFGAPFLGLSRDAFQLFENGVQQPIRSFSCEDAPVSLGVVFDTSGSMRGKLDEARAAVSRFFATARQQDEFFLVEFSDAPRLLCDFTADAARIETALAGLEPKNWTALLDAVYLATQQMRSARNPRKALLVLSDGGDNNSRYTESEMKRLVREADVCIYSIALPGGGLLRRHVKVLRELAEETGGRVCEVEKTADLPAAVEQISAAMRTQYLLGFSPGKTGTAGLYRKIRVRLNPPPNLPPLHAAWRTGYYPPVEP